jgi:hypothetical protein
MRPSLACASFVLLQFLTALTAQRAAAQPGSTGELLFVGDTAVQVENAWTRTAQTVTGSVEVRTAAASVTAHRGPPMSVWSSAGPRGVALALVGATLEVIFVPIANGRPGAPVRRDIHRIAGGDRAPIGAAVATRPDGFAVFWQEASTTDPNEAYRTFLARFDPGGAPIEAEREVPAVWPLADAAWVEAEQRYYFLLYYGTGDPNGTRLCGVHIDGATLTPVEHPWWASRPSVIDEAQLVVTDAGIVAVYRGGADGRHLLEANVTAGNWGSDPSAPVDHGRIGSSDPFGVRASGRGVDIARRAIPRRQSP